MPACPECGAEVTEDALVCHHCGTGLDRPGSDTGPLISQADYDPDEARERFERRYGIDIGDRTVEEFLTHLDRQDYSLTVWFWSVVVAELVGVALFSVTVFEIVTIATGLEHMFTGVSVALGIAIFADTAGVGQFERWSRIRWTYVVLGAVPLVGHIAGVLYLLVRHLKHEQTVQYRTRLLNAGIDLNHGVVDD